MDLKHKQLESMNLNDAKNWYKMFLPEIKPNKLGKLKGKKIFYNDKVTILKTLDGKFVSKNTDEVYDLEKGVMMALLLSEGYKFRDIITLIERAKKFKK